jgi:hypothetical protein
MAAAPRTDHQPFTEVSDIGLPADVLRNTNSLLSQSTLPCNKKGIRRSDMVDADPWRYAIVPHHCL